jgi:hypothetical protein
MADTKEYFTLEIIGNNRIKSGDQISEWLHPKVEEMKNKMNDWDWSKPFEFEMPEKSLVSEFDEILKDNRLPDELPKVGKFQLYDSSKLTDFIKGSFLEQYGLIVSEKAKTVLTKFNLGNHKFFPLTVCYKNIDYNNYFFLKCLTTSNDYIDFGKTDFYTQKSFFDKESKSQIAFKTKEELLNFRNETTKHKLFLFADKVKLGDDFPEFDLFELNDFGINEIFVTTSLSKELNKLTGLILTKSEKIS